jgi:type VI secretion system lysozyme-like protein
MLRKFLRRKTSQSALHDIVDNLNNVLNTRKGFGSFVKNFGIGDWNAYKSRGKIVETIMAEIKENIANYEPRVRLDHIEEVAADSPFRLRFQVKCVYGEDAERPIYIVLDSLYNRVFVEE